MAGAGMTRVWAFTAVGGVVVVAALVVVLGSRDDSPDVAAGGDGYLVAGELPAGWDVMLAADAATMAERPVDEWDPSSNLAGEVVVYGDSDQEDPWDGPVLTVKRYDEELPLGPDTSEPPEEMSVDGEPFTVYDEHLEDVGEGVIYVRADDDNILVVAYDMPRDQVLTSLEHLDSEPQISSEGLPDGYEEIARGPLSATEPAAPRLSEGGLTLGFGQESIYTPNPDITLTQNPAEDSDAVGLIRLWPLEISYAETSTELTQIRGSDAYVLRQEELDGGYDPADAIQEVQWFEPSLGQVVTLSAVGTDQAEVDAVIDGLRAGSQAEVDGLLARDYPALEPEPDCSDVVVPSGGGQQNSGPGDGVEPPPPVEGPPREGSVVLTEGQDSERSWRLTFLDEGDGCVRTLELDIARTSGFSRNSVNLESSLTEAETHVAEPWYHEDATVGIYGFVDDEIAEVRLEHSGGESYDLELFPLDSVEANAVVGFVPLETTAYAFVALDEEGEVIDEWSDLAPEY